MGALPFVVALIVNIWEVVIIHKSYSIKHSESVEFNLNDLKKATVARNQAFYKLKAKYHKQQVCLTQVFGALLHTFLHGPQ